jgi:hypothetical protein
MGGETGGDDAERAGAGAGKPARAEELVSGVPRG